MFNYVLQNDTILHIVIEMYTAIYTTCIHLLHGVTLLHRRSCVLVLTEAIVIPVVKNQVPGHKFFHSLRIGGITFVPLQLPTTSPISCNTSRLP